MVELLVLKWGRLFVATKLVLKWTYKKKFVAIYFLYVATNSKLGPQKICRNKISICRDIIQLEQGQFPIAIKFFSVAIKNCPNPKLSEKFMSRHHFSMSRHRLKKHNFRSKFFMTSNEAQLLAYK